MTEIPIILPPRRVIELIPDRPVNRALELLPWDGTDIRPRLDQRLAAWSIRSTCMCAVFGGRFQPNRGI